MYFRDVRTLDDLLLYVEKEMDKCRSARKSIYDEIDRAELNAERGVLENMKSLIKQIQTPPENSGKEG